MDKRKVNCYSVLLVQLHRKYPSPASRLDYPPPTLLGKMSLSSKAKCYVDVQLLCRTLFKFKTYLLAAVLFLAVNLNLVLVIVFWTNCFLILVTLYTFYKQKYIYKILHTCRNFIMKFLYVCNIF